MIYPNNFESKIGFDFIRKSIESKCISTLGVGECANIQFLTDYNSIISKLNETNEFLNILNGADEFPMESIYDTTHALNHIRIVGTYITEGELFNLKRTLITIADIRAFFNKGINEENPDNHPYPYLHTLTADIENFPHIITEIDKVLDKYGNVKENATPTLANIVKSIANTTASINGMIRRIISSGRQSGILEKDTTPTIRDGRLVIPVPPMHKRKIRGIIHDESATGKTIFIEPAEIVEANNNIRELQTEMQREIIRILTTVADTIRPHITELLNSYTILGKLDVIKAKAHFAQQYNCLLPNMHSTPQVEWYHAIHPLLSSTLQEQGKSIVPLNVTLDATNRILIISGPNAGGKSVCLKTVGVIQYMTQCGILPPVYENSHIGTFDSIFIDIGDQQSLEDDLSTYSSHLTNMKQFMSRGNERTLILIDEFGAGTEPTIGGAIAQSILEQLNNRGMYGIITTHYQNLKHYAEETDGIVNGAMLYDRQHMTPLFQLSIGYPGSSFAVEIARKIGLPTEVINSAQQIVGSDYINMDKYLLDITRDKKYWEQKRQKIRQKEKKVETLLEQYTADVEKINSQHRQILRDAKQQAAELLSQSNASIERTIHDIKRANADKEETKRIRQELAQFRERLNQEQNSEPLAHKPQVRQNRNKKEQPKTTSEKTTLQVNDYVTLSGSNTTGQIISIDGRNATIAFGNIKTTAKLASLKASQKPRAEKKSTTFLSSSSTDEIRQKQLQFKQEIDLRGMRADEAIQATTYFIDDAIQFSTKQVRILHGTGNGILRQLIRQYLNSVSGIKSYRDEHVQFGGAGITVVDFF